VSRRTVPKRYAKDYGTALITDFEASLTSVGGSPTQPAAAADQNDATHFLSGTGACHVTVDDPGGDSIALLRFNDATVDWTRVDSVNIWVYDATQTDTATSLASDLQLKFFLYESAFQTTGTGYQDSGVAGTRPADRFTPNHWKVYTIQIADMVDETAGANIGSPGGLDAIVWYAIQISSRGTASVANCWIDSVYLNQRARSKILWTFDDALASVKDEAYDYMNPLGLKGTAFTPSNVLIAGSNLTLADAQTMYANDWDIGNHSNSATELDGVSTAQGIANLDECRDYLIANGMPRGANFIAYPGNKSTVDLRTACLTNGYLWGRGSSTANDNYMPVIGHPDVEDQWPLERFGGWNVLAINETDYDAGAGSGANIKASIDAAVKYGRTVFLMVHDIPTSGATGNEINQANFQDLVDYTKAIQDAGKADVVTISQWYEGLSNPRLTTDRATA